MPSSCQLTTEAAQITFTSIKLLFLNQSLSNQIKSINTFHIYKIYQIVKYQSTTRTVVSSRYVLLSRIASKLHHHRRTNTNISKFRFYRQNKFAFQKNMEQIHARSIPHSEKHTRPARASLVLILKLKISCFYDLADLADLAAQRQRRWRTLSRTAD